MYRSFHLVLLRSAAFCALVLQMEQMGGGTQEDTVGPLRWVLSVTAPCVGRDDATKCLELAIWRRDFS